MTRVLAAMVFVAALSASSGVHARPVVNGFPSVCEGLLSPWDEDCASRCTWTALGWRCFV